MKPDQNRFRAVHDTDIDGMRSQTAADNERGGPFHMQSPAIRVEKLELRGHDAASQRKPDGTAVKMTGQDKIRAPV